MILSNKIFSKNNQINKRLLIGSIWTVINFIVLSSITVSMFGTGWEVFWFFGLVIYALSYWILTSVLLDKLVGEEY